VRAVVPFFLDSASPLSRRDAALEGGAFFVGEPSTSISESESLSAFAEAAGVGSMLDCSCGADAAASVWFFVAASCSRRSRFHLSDNSCMQVVSSVR
jgi:hypothetical protein